MRKTQKKWTDFQSAIIYIRTRHEINPKQLILWGTSYAGGHVLAFTGGYLGEFVLSNRIERMKKKNAPILSTSSKNKKENSVLRFSAPSPRAKQKTQKNKQKMKAWKSGRFNQRVCKLPLRTKHENATWNNRCHFPNAIYRKYSRRKQNGRI